MAGSLIVNGRRHDITASPDMPLLWFLRDVLALTGTKYGCGVGTCGACLVHRDGRAVRACQVTLSAVAGARITTIEGLSAGGPHPVQQAWLDEDVAQCGYCQPGMIMAMAALLAGETAPDDDAVSAILSNHLCRCGTYTRIRRAVQRAREGTRHA